MNSIHPRVVALTVTYGKRWSYLSQVLNAVMKDSHVVSFVIIDNGSFNKEEIEQGVRVYGDKVSVLRLEKNIGSAGGFAVGIEYVRKIDCDYVFILDDDNIPEEGAIQKFLEIQQQIGKEKTVLVGNRVNIPGNEEIFYRDDVPVTIPKGTFFEVLSFKKIKHFISLAFGKELQIKRRRTIPHAYLPQESFVYGGSFLPIDAVRRAPLPDKDLILYGDDIEYSWGVINLGYSSYVCFEPKIFDIEMSFGDGSQAVGIFDPATAPFKLYYRIRNMIRISRRNTKQSNVALFLNIVVWLIGLCFLGLIRYGISKSYFRKLRILLLAFYGGYVTKASIPVEAKLR